jgi:hypothetical protein
MKKFLPVLFLIGLIISSGCTRTTPKIINCEKDYDCLYQQIAQGNTAKVTLTEEIESLSLIETSEITIKPTGNQYEITMTVLDLQKVEQEKETIKSITGALSKICPQIVNQLDKIKLKSAICTANSPREAQQLAINGLSETAIKTYNCHGELVNAIKNICITPESPNFPPGIKKPAIYLYPSETTNVNVMLSLNGFITKSEPYYKNGWNVTAEPNGIINGKYDYLFYEAQLYKLDLPQEGWVVAYRNLEQWFDTQLPLLGLNKKETSQFKEYWIKELPLANYYEIKLLNTEFLDDNMSLIINPQPDTVIRLNFYFKPIDQNYNHPEPQIKTSTRKGFTVVEWGGLVDL